MAKIFLINSYRDQKGLTLVEILVALTLGLFVTATVLQIFLSSKRVYLTQEQNSGIQENGNFALEWLNKYIRITGYRNDPTIQNTYSFGNNDINACGQAITLKEGQVIIGKDNVIDSVKGNYNSGCIIFRYRGNVDGSITDCFGTPVNNNAETVINVFFLAFDQNINDWALRCKSTTLSANGSTVRTATFVNNVQDMQILYGTSTGTYLTAANVTDWTNVVSVKIALLLSSENNGVSVTNQHQTYTYPPWPLSSNQPPVMVTANDFRLRRIFTTTINLRNQTR